MTFNIANPILVEDSYDLKRLFNQLDTDEIIDCLPGSVLITLKTELGKEYLDENSNEVIEDFEKELGDFLNDKVSQINDPELRNLFRMFFLFKFSDFDFQKLIDYLNEKYK